MQIKLAENYYALNGTIKPLKGFSYTLPSSSKIIYEVLRVKSSTPIFFEQHIDRLFNSINILGFAKPDKDLIKGMVADLLRINPVYENNIRVSLIYSSSTSSDILAYFIPSSYPTESQMDNGVSVKTLNAYRQTPNVKVENSTLREKADTIISESGCYEVLLVDKNGSIAEGSRSNVFFIKGDKLFTPPLEMVLGGITRQVVMNFSKAFKISLNEEPISTDRLKEFESAFLTGTSPGVLPISLIDNKRFKVNTPILQKLIYEYNNAVAKDIANFKEI